MSTYRRAQTPGGRYFFTVVTYRRQPLLIHPESRRILRGIIREVRRWGLIKAGFSKGALALFKRAEWIDRSMAKHRESTIWQRRFWEHQIRGQEDFDRHVDYIHWNPVKHGHVPRVADWPYSTFHVTSMPGYTPRTGAAVKPPGSTPRILANSGHGPPKTRMLILECSACAGCGGRCPSYIAT
jgi:putative transposase